MKKLLSPLAFLAIPLSIFSQEISNFIHVDQFGYMPASEKVAVLSNPQVGYNSNLSYTPSATIELRDASNDAIIYSAAPSIWNSGNVHEQSGDAGWWFDFSSVETEGVYYVIDPVHNEQSATFTISEASYVDVIKAAGRMFYYNRCNAPKEEPYAQGWSDGNNFNNALQDFNCRFIEDPANASLEKDLSGGWFDAGDYNKYVTFTNSTLHNLLSAYQENPQAFGDNWNIPESGNGIPDLIDEIKWELDWLLKMTNSDGSVHIKMGSQNHSENFSSPPSANTDQRFYGPACSSASISIASIFSHAALVLREFSSLENYAATLEQVATSTYNYSKTFIDNNTLETDCDDGSIVAGDADMTADQQRAAFMVASIYLFELTNDTSYNNYITGNVLYLEQLSTGFWGPYFTEVNDALYHYTTLANSNSSTNALIINSFSDAVNNNFNGFFGFSEDDLYRSPMPNWSYHWGSNQPKAGYGALNRLAEKSGVNSGNDEAFETYIDETIHYFHGVNPQGMVYLSNMYSNGAERSANEIYHGWFADGTDYDNALTSSIGPAPGFIVGGANSQFTVSNLVPPFGQPDQKSYLDFNDGFPHNSWEITEPAIYYQAFYLRLLANNVDAQEILSTPDVINYTFQIYPNPAFETLNISAAKIGDKVQIYSLLGSLVLEETMTSKHVDVRSIASGVYFVYLRSSDQDFSPVKFIKQ